MRTCAHFNFLVIRLRVLMQNNQVVPSIKLVWLYVANAKTSTHYITLVIRLHFSTIQWPLYDNTMTIVWQINDYLMAIQWFNGPGSSRLFWCGSKPECDTMPVVISNDNIKKAKRTKYGSYEVKKEIKLKFCAIFVINKSKFWKYAKYACNA